VRNGPQFSFPHRYRRCGLVKETNAVVPEAIDLIITLPEEHFKRPQALSTLGVEGALSKAVL